MKENKPTVIVGFTFFLFFFSFLGGLHAQEKKNIQNSRAAFFAGKFKISQNEAEKILVLMDSTTKQMNKIFSDSTLTSIEKRKRLNAIDKNKAAAIRQIIPNRAGLFFAPTQRRTPQN